MRNDDSPPPPAGWSEYVKWGRKRINVTGPELARRIKVERSTVYRWEAAGTRPESGDVVARLAEALDRPIDEVLSRAGLRPASDVVEPERSAPAADIDPRALAIAESFQIMSNRLNDPNTTKDEAIQIETKLDMLVELARQIAAERRART